MSARRQGPLDGMLKTFAIIFGLLLLLEVAGALLSNGGGQ